MVEFIDKTSEQNGTPINRANLMALQGFIAKNTVFNADGSVVETNEKGEILTTTYDKESNTITEVFVGEKTITRIIHLDDMREEVL